MLQKERNNNGSLRSDRLSGPLAVCAVLCCLRRDLSWNLDGSYESYSLAAAAAAAAVKSTVVVWYSVVLTGDRKAINLENTIMAGSVRIHCGVKKVSSQAWITFKSRYPG